MNGIFNDREIATAVWLVLFLAWTLTKSEIRSSFCDLLKALLKWKILVPLLSMFGYMALVIAGLEMLGFWDATATKDTVLWVLLVAMVLLFRANKAQKEGSFFKDTVFDNLKLIAVLEFVSNAHTFSLPVELIIVPVFTFVAMLKAVTEFKREAEPHYEAADKLLGYLLVIAGSTLIGIAVWKVLRDIDGFATVQTLRDFLLPVVLSALYLPFVYIWALFLAYENVFVRIGIANKDRELTMHLKKMVLMSFHLNLKKLVQWSQCVSNLHIESRCDAAELISNPIPVDELNR